MTGTAPEPAALLAEAKARENALRDVLGVISRSRDDEQPVFQFILQKAAELCRAPMARLHLVSEDRTAFSVVAFWGDAPRAMDIGDSWPLNPDITLWRTMIEGETLHLEDHAQTENYLRGDPIAVKIVEEEGIRTRLSVPLMLGETPIGSLTLSRREVHPFLATEIALVETFAAQAVIAIENVRQFRELQTRLEREAASREILGAISRSRADPTAVFEIILKNALKLCRAPQASLSLVSEDGTELVPAAREGHVDDPGQTFRRTGVPLNQHGMRTQAVQEKRTIPIDDVRETEFYKDGEPNIRALADVLGARTALLVPLISADESVGVLLIYRNEIKPFTADEIALVETFAAQAVIAIENVRQFKALEARTLEVEALNASLEERVEEQVGEIERMGRLKSFLPAAVADAVVTQGETMLSSHRALIAILFCDIRGFTAFCETAEPEETIEVLQSYHEEMGDLISAHGGGVDKRMGDGIMVIFNDPLPVDDPAGDAVRLAIAMRDRMAALAAKWKKLGHRLGFGVGISLGYATVGMVGSAGRFDYTANGTAVNLAARLCDRAGDGEILASPRAWIAVEDEFTGEEVGEMEFKGLNAPVTVTRVLGPVSPA